MGFEKKRGKVFWVSCERERERDPLAKEDWGARLKSCGLCNWILDLLL